MAIGKNFSVAVGDDWQLVTPGAFDCTVGGTRGYARRIVMLAAGDLSPCVNANGTNRALTGLPTGYVHDAHVQSFTTTANCVVYW